MATRVVFAEDSYIVREGVRMLLEEAGYEIAALAEDYDELMAAVESASPEVVITDIRMPPTRSDEGVRAAREIRAAHPEIGVVVLSQYVEPDYALALRLGRRRLPAEGARRRHRTAHPGDRGGERRRVGGGPEGGGRARGRSDRPFGVEDRSTHAP